MNDEEKVVLELASKAWNKRIGISGGGMLYNFESAIPIGIGVRELRLFAKAIRDQEAAKRARLVEAAQIILKEMGENYNEHEPMNSWASMLNEVVMAKERSE